jgi:hypothetical protein
MCPICDGKTQEDLLAEADERIDEFGFTVMGVEPDPDHPPWLYTVGLVEHGHPEVAVLDVPLDLAFSLLQEIGLRVVDGEVFTPGEGVVANGLHFHVADVDERLWNGDMFNQWKAYYAYCGAADVEASAVELVLCGNRHGTSVEAPFKPNRAARRAQRRRRPRS